MLLAAVLCWPAVHVFGQTSISLAFVDAEGNTIRQAEATIGEDFIEPRLVITPAEAAVRVVYSSTNPNVAEVNMMSGEVTLLTAGNTTIMAQSGQTEEYYSARAAYQLTVNDRETPPSPEPTCPEAYFYSNGARLESLTLHVGDAVDVPMLLASTGGILSGGRITVDNTDIAIVTADNLIRGLVEGQTILHATFAITNDGNVLTCDYSLPIIVAPGAPQKEKPELAFDPQEVSIELGDDVVVPTIVNPHNIAFTSANSKWYTAWDSKVAQVDEATGEVTILGIGDEIISFEFTGNDEYEAQIIGYNLHVTTMGLAVGGVIVNEKNKDDVFGDKGSITYDPITHTLTMTNAVVDGAGINLAPARIKAAKADQQIQAAILYVDDAPLTIVLIGGNAIVNAEAGILSNYAPVVMMSPEGAYGSARISASTVGVKTEALKLYKCNVTAFGGAAGVAVNVLGVATGANLVAQGQGLAIQANDLIMAEDHEGEGIAILTEGVTFEKGKGFFKDGKVATFVEIGKVAIPVPDDEVTTIDFTQVDPEGNESVVFSADVNNTYNEETGQLEITTALTDDVVADALESLIPGSSAWVEALPGSIVFDIPAGEGEILVQCLTLPGYVLKLKMEGEAAVTIEQTSFGWAKVNYNVLSPVHVVIYLHASGSSSAPARIAASQKDTEPSVGAYIQALQIKPKDAPQGFENIVVNGDQTMKVLFDGHIYILRGGKAYTVQGAEVK